MSCVVYKAGYKYQIKAPFAVRIEIRPGTPIHTDFIDLDTEGNLALRNGYAWDGPSGPTFDTPTFMRGSLVHDALYQLMREGCLDRAIHREAADRILRALCLEDGMNPLRAWWVYHGVRLFADPAADPAADKPLLRAPQDCQP